MLHAGTLGLQLRPVKPLLLQFDAELGRNSHPFYPVSEKDYHGLNGRAFYRTRSYTLSAQAKSNYNFNSQSLFSYSARLRQYSADVSWTPRAGLALEAGYARIHTDTLTGLAFFVSNQLVSNQRSVYISNLHTAHLGLHVMAGSRVSLFAGCSHAEDTGASQLPPVSVPALALVQTYPLRFLSPMGRVSVKLTEKLRWNAGYEYYGYREELLALQDYGAHTLYSSVLWSF